MSGRTKHQSKLLTRLTTLGFRGAEVMRHIESGSEVGSGARKGIVQRAP